MKLAAASHMPLPSTVHLPGPPDGSLLFAPLFEIQHGEDGLDLFDTSGTGPASTIPTEGHVG